MFLTALEALHRRLSVFPHVVGIIVSVGYPIAPDSASVFDPRRKWDLTPPSPGCDPFEGGADELIDLISGVVKKLAYRRLHETRGVNPGKEALFGHSLGGLFCLHTLFTRSHLFDCYIASSPSIWWNDRYLLGEEAAFREGRRGDDKLSRRQKPSLIMSVGGQEQDPPQNKNETDDDYEKRRQLYQQLRMVDNMREVYERLELSDKLHNTHSTIYEGEDHGTVISCSLSRGMTTFLEDWPLKC